MEEVCSDPQKSSECGSAVSTRSSLSEEEDMGWSSSWPPTVWHCFLKGRLTHTCTLAHALVRAHTNTLAVGPQLSPPPPLPAGTRLRFHRGANVEWQDVEELDSGEEDEEEERSVSLKVGPRHGWLKVKGRSRSCSR